MVTEQIKIIILGGGFGGIQTALALSRKKIPNAKIVLISDKHHFEYTPALYRIVTGKSPLEVCIPLSEIFPERENKVQIVLDTISKINPVQKILEGAEGSQYRYDYLVLALGAEPAFFGIPGLPEFAYGFKTIGQAIKLKNHLHSILGDHKHENSGEIHFDVVGAGPAGVELAGELHQYTNVLAKHHGIPEKEIHIDIIESASRLLPMMPEKASVLAALRLKQYGTNIMTDTKVMSDDGKSITLSTGKMLSKTLIWTAGVKPNHIYKETLGLPLAKNGRITVDESLRVVGIPSIFVLGDSADTPHSGTAQTAICDGEFIAWTLARMLKTTKKILPKYEPKTEPYIIPVGAGYAILIYKNFVMGGRLIWWLREMADLKYFLSILPFDAAWRVWKSGKQLCESCPTCEEASN